MYDGGADRSTVWTNAGEAVGGRATFDVLLEEAMRTFDALPGAVRAELNYATAEWSVPHFADAHREAVRLYGAEQGLEVTVETVRWNDRNWRDQAYLERGFSARETAWHVRRRATPRVGAGAARTRALTRAAEQAGARFDRARAREAARYAARARGIVPAAAGS